MTTEEKQLENELQKENKSDEPQTEAEREMGETIHCKGPYCIDEREVFQETTVDVAVGEAVELRENEVTIQGLDNSQPTVVQWCRICAEQEFDVTDSAGERNTEIISPFLPFLTPKNVALVLSWTLVFLLLTVAFW